MVTVQQNNKTEPVKVKGPRISRLERLNKEIEMARVAEAEKLDKKIAIAQAKLDKAIEAFDKAEERMDKAHDELNMLNMLKPGTPENTEE